MRGSLGLMGACVVACTGPRSDAEAYRAALVTTETFEAARSACAEITDAGTQGDCQVTITERFERLDPADCRHVTDPVWLDECRFLLAERVGKSGDLPKALQICKRSRFRRYCAWHLLQDGVEDTLGLPAAEAEEILEGFGGIDALKDAPFQFWRIRWREQAGRGDSANEEDCHGLVHEVGCEQALTRHVWELLETVSRSDRSRVCGLPIGQRVTNRGTPGWVLGPLTTSAEASWAAQRCPSDAAGR